MDITLDQRAAGATIEAPAAVSATEPPAPARGVVPPEPPRPATPPAVAVAPHHRARWITAAIGAVLLIGIAWRYLPALLFGPIVVAAPVLPTDLVQTLVASGHVATRYRAEIGTQITGVVVRVPVTEGQSVRAGDTLIVLDDTESSALALQALGQVQQATAQLRQLRELTLPAAEETLAQATATRLNAEQTFNRNLTALGYDSPAALDDVRKNLDVARAAERAAQLVVFTDRPGGSTATVIATQLAQAKATLAATRTRVGYRAIGAPRAGVLISRDVEVGDVAQIGKALMMLSPAGELDIVVQVDEKNLGLVAIGQTALASADAFPTQTFAAEVRYINPGIDLLRASVEVQLRVPAPPAYVRQDMTVSVDIETARRPHVLVVPTEDVHDRAGAQPWLLVVRDGHARRQPVTVGLTSAGRAEITTGLRDGETVIPLTAGTIAVGHRVRLHAPPSATP